MQPRTEYVKGPEGYVAYQVFGRGPRDIVFIPDHPNNIDVMWEDPATSRFLERLGYRLTMLAALLFLVWLVERWSLAAAVVFAFALAFGSFYLFDTLLRVPLPRGPFNI